MTLILLGQHLSFALVFILAFLFLCQLLLSRRPPQSIFAWILLVLFVPYIGVPLYLMFGGRKMLRLARKKGALYEPEDAIADNYRRRVERMLSSRGGPPASPGNEVLPLGTGESIYAEVCRNIASAKVSIEIATFILGNDEVGLDILARLTEKARAGVKVRLLLDSIGCFWLRRSVLADFVRAGGEYAFFMPVLHIPFRGYANLRNHRKILVFDGVRAIVGGMNLAWEYLGPKPAPGRWRDLALWICGPAVLDIREIFRLDWEFASHKPFVIEEGVPPVRFAAGAQVQVVGSGPDVEGDPLYDAILSEVFTAEKRIWLATPYFIPDEALSRGLELAARRGVDVRILVPARSNHVLADLARGTGLRSIQAAGGKVYLYQPSMMHAKVTVIDDDTGVVASANLDLRSLFLNYEIAVFLYTAQSVDELSIWFEELMEHSTVSVPKVSRPREVLEGLVRLVSPLL